MAKLHSEKRIKAVNTGSSEDGDPTLFEEGDVVYSSVDNQFKRKTGALGAGGWDAIAGGGSGEENVQADWGESDNTSDAFIQNKPAIPSTLADLSNVSNSAPSNGQVLKWNNAGGEWEPGSSAAGSAASSFTFDDHLIPDTNAAYDLGNAEYKIRHLFLSDNSLWVGDAGKISVSNDTIRIIKRKKSKWPSGIPHSSDNVNTLRTYDASYNNLPNSSPLDPLTDWSIVSLQHWVQLSKSLNASNTIDTVYPAGEASNFEYPEGDGALGLAPMSPTAPSTAIVRNFDVVVGSKDNDRYPEQIVGFLELLLLYT